ncbi:hypothetical protein KEM52_004484 [Ascosphaera acerosa]|nr:hypothetical protein KEM52_004484 [Ascosphaera acerosa]
MARAPPPPRPTHFLCLPLVGPAVAPQLAAALEHFRHRAAALQPALPAAAIRPLGTLHLTLGVMSLPDAQRLQHAVALLHALDLRAVLRQAQRQRTRIEAAASAAAVATATATGEKEEETSPLRISLVSLGALPSVEAARVLYARPHDPSGCLHAFADAVRQRFVQAGLVREDLEAVRVPGRRKPRLQPRPLLLHATVANTVYASKVQRRNHGSNGNGRPDQQLRQQYTAQTFDATPLLNDLGGIVTATATATATTTSISTQTAASTPSFVWAEGLPIDCLCICEMGARPVEHEPLLASGGPSLGLEYKAVTQRLIPAA